MQTETTYTLVTGGTSGIGYELAKLFGSMGHNLIIVARSEDELRRKQEELSTPGVDVIPIAKDLFEPHAAFELYEDVKGRMSGKDKVVSGAKNKMKTTIANVIPETTVTKMVEKEQEPVSKNK